jgi:hypothetical protein
VNAAVADSPGESATWQLTFVTPRGNVDPDAGTHVGVSVPSHGSLAVATYETLAPAGPVASAETAAGTIRAGGALGMINANGDNDIVTPHKTLLLAFVSEDDASGHQGVWPHVVFPSSWTRRRKGAIARDTSCVLYFTQIVIELEYDAVVEKSHWRLPIPFEPTATR